MLMIKAEPREIFGKKLKSYRQQGQLPVIIYGAKERSLPLFVQLAEFKKLITAAGESTVVTVETPAGDKSTLIHEVARHPVSGEPLHADFYVIDKSKAIKVNVPLRFEGVAPAVKDLNATLVKVLHELSIETLPLNIPHDIVVDVSSLLSLDSQILVKDLTVPATVKVLNDPEEVVAAASVAKEEPVEEAPVDLTAIEVEKKGKKEEAEDDGGETTKSPDAAA